MSWILGGDTINAPQSKVEERRIQSVVHRTINGLHSRDFIGAEKKVFECEWSTISQADFDTIVRHYNGQIDSGETVSLEITELNFAADVLIEIGNIDFNIANHYGYRKFSARFIEI